MNGSEKPNRRDPDIAASSHDWTEIEIQSMRHALLEVYEWTKDVGTTLDAEDVNAVYKVVCEGLGLEVGPETDGPGQSSVPVEPSRANAKADAAPVAARNQDWPKGGLPHGEHPYWRIVWRIPDIAASWRDRFRDPKGWLLDALPWPLRRLWWWRRLGDWKASASGRYFQIRDVSQSVIDYFDKLEGRGREAGWYGN